MKRAILLSPFLLVPALASAQQTFQDFAQNLIVVLSDVIIPFLIGIAFLIFIINAIRFFVLGASNEQGREKAKALALYSILAFVIIIIFWGIINMLSSSLGLEGCKAPKSDYVLNSFVGPMQPLCP